MTEKSKEKLKLFFDEKKVDEKVGEKIKLFVTKKIREKKIRFTFYEEKSTKIFRNKSGKYDENIDFTKNVDKT